MGPHWIEAFRYHRWANLFILDACSRLTDAQLELTLPGTYGAIHATLQHLISSEQRYIARLTEADVAITERDAFPGVPRLTEIAQKSADRLIDLAETVKPDPTFQARFRDGLYRMEPGIVMLQALHHGNDHRTHVCTILGAHGIEYGDMDLWAYGAATGALEKISG